MSEQQTAAPEVAAVSDESDAQVAEVTEAFDASRALEKIRKANAEAKSLRDRARAAEEAKAAAEDKVKAAQEAAQRLPELESRLLRAEVALELGIPASLAKRLVGGSREELLADAEELMATMAPKAGPKQVRPVAELQTGSGKAEAGPRQLTREDLRGMAPEAIEAARVAGQLNGLLGIK